MRWASLVVTCLTLVPGAAAAGPLEIQAEPEREDDHVRPIEIESFASEPTPPSAVESEYPLSAFDPACDCNHSVGGMIEYKYFVVHTMQGSYAGTKSWFKNPDAQVSTHYIVRSVDGEITQMVLHKDKAWHVGSSNPYAIGVEHEGYVDDPNKWYTWEMYVSSARLARWVTKALDMPVDRDHIVGHVELPNQTHTDPGPGWNWDMYMGLVWDVVPQGEIHVVVVDRSKLCTITANTDTYLQRTAEATELLAPEELCPIAAGTQVTYMHASGPIGARRRLLMEPGQGPCAGQGNLDAEAFIDETKFSALCDPTTMAAVGATVSLDGGAPLPVGPDGVLLLPPVGQGAHALDVAAPDVYEPASEMVDVAVYPGTRLAIAVDPVPVEPPPDDTTAGGGETGGGETGGETGSAQTGGGETGAGPGGGEAGGAEGGSEPVTTGQASGDPGEGGGEAGDPSDGSPALPNGYGQHGDEGCGCDSGAPGGAGLLALLWAIRPGRRRLV
jgi:hypothetical protein